MGSFKFNKILNALTVIHNVEHVKMKIRKTVFNVKESKDIYYHPILNVYVKTGFIYKME
jgi:hypothetical protein